MASISKSLVTLGSLLLLSTAQLGAQQLADARVTLRPMVVPSPGAQLVAPIGLATTIGAFNPRTPHRWPYVVGGAVLGAIAGGVSLAARVKRTDDGMVFPMYMAGATATGAGLGALGGLIVSSIVRQ